VSREPNEVCQKGVAVAGALVGVAASLDKRWMWVWPALQAIYGDGAAKVLTELCTDDWAKG